MTVGEFLKSHQRHVVTTSPQTPIRDAMALLIDNQIGYLPVINEKDEIEGIIGEREIFKAAFKNPVGFSNASVRDVMTTDPIVGVLDDDLEYIAAVMTNNRLRRVPIVENRRLVGLLSLWDMVRSQLKDMQSENRYLRQYIDDKYPG